jgi:two-component system OmpR family response regulator
MQVITKTKSLRVLCVDDEVHVLSMVSDTLRAQGHQVDTALDGAHALQKIATIERPYDLLVVDGRMPNVDGWALILQARTGGYKGKVIVFSAWLDADEHKRYRQLKIDGVIEKPPKPGELVRVVREMTADAA